MLIDMALHFVSKSDFESRRVRRPERWCVHASQASESASIIQNLASAFYVRPYRLLLSHSTQAQQRRYMALPKWASVCEAAVYRGISVVFRTFVDLWSFVASKWMASIYSKGWSHSNISLTQAFRFLDPDDWEDHDGFPCLHTTLIVKQERCTFAA